MPLQVLTSVGLYIRSGQLPLSSLVEEFRVAKCRGVVIYKDSKDNKVREARIKNFIRTKVGGVCSRGTRQDLDKRS